jgi:hypothetical protein
MSEPYREEREGKRREGREVRGGEGRDEGDKYREKKQINTADRKQKRREDRHFGL